MKDFLEFYLKQFMLVLFVVAYKNNGTEFIDNFENTITVNSKDLEII